MEASKERKLKEYKANEADVVKKLNRIAKTNFELTTYEYEHFDASGTRDNGELVLIEVKNRYQWFSDLYIEVYKIEQMVKHLRHTAKGGQGYLVCTNNSPKGDGKHYLFNIETIMNCPTGMRWMKQTTAFDNNESVLKEVYIFPTNKLITTF